MHQILKDFNIYALSKKDDINEHLGEEFFKCTPYKPSRFINAQKVSARFKLSPATYVIIPSTFSPGSDGRFLLRAFFEKKETIVYKEKEKE